MNFPSDSTTNSNTDTAVAVAGVEPQEKIITCGAFWPDIDPGQCRMEMRLDGTVTAPRLRAALIAAIDQVQGNLSTWSKQQRALGHATLVATNPREIDGINLNEWRFKRAVYCYAAANLQERMRGFDSTHEGHTRADALTDPIDDHRRDGRWAVSDILGESRTYVELI